MKRMRLLIVFFIAIVAITAIAGSNVLTSGNEKKKAMEEKHFITENEIKSAGIPSNVIPAKAYFSADSVGESEAWSDNFLFESCLVSDNQDYGTYCFFVSETKEREYECPMIDIWCYDVENHKAWKVYHQSGKDNEVPNVMDIKWAFNIDSQDTLVNFAGSKKQYSVIQKKAKPVLILSLIKTLATPHSSYMVELVDITTGKVKTIDGEKLIGVFDTDDAQLPAAEIGSGKKYVLTTTSSYKSSTIELNSSTDEDSNQSEDDSLMQADFINHVGITPTLNVYSLDGEKVGSVNLPVDKIDVVR